MVLDPVLSGRQVHRPAYTSALYVASWGAFLCGDISVTHEDTYFHVSCGRRISASTSLYGRTPKVFFSELASCGGEGGEVVGLSSFFLFPERDTSSWMSGVRTFRLCVCCDVTWSALLSLCYAGRKSVDSISKKLSRPQPNCCLGST